MSYFFFKCVSNQSANSFKSFSMSGQLRLRVWEIPQDRSSEQFDIRASKSVETSEATPHNKSHERAPLDPDHAAGVPGPGCRLRRHLPSRRPHHRGLLPAELPGPQSVAQERGVLRDGEGGPGRRLPPLQTLPADEG